MSIYYKLILKFTNDRIPMFMKIPGVLYCVFTNKFLGISENECQGKASDYLCREHTCL